MHRLGKEMTLAEYSEDKRSGNIRKYHGKAYGFTLCFIADRDHTFGELPAMNELAKIAQADYPELKLEDISVQYFDKNRVDEVIEFYCVSFTLPDAYDKPNDDYLPLSTIYPSGYELD